MSMNSCKDMKDDAEFENWSKNHGNHTNTLGTNGGYGNNSGPSQITDPYSMSGQSYYPVSASMFPYTTANDHNTAWSNGTGHSEMTFLTGYAGTAGDGTGQAGHHSNAHYMDMFGSQNSFGYNNFNTFFHGGTSTAAASGNDHFWSTSAGGPPSKQSQRGQLTVGPYRSVHDEQSYYQRDAYSDTSNSVKHLDSQMSSLNLDHIKSDQFNNKSISSSFASNSNSYESNKRFDSIGSTSNSVIGQAPPKKMSWASVASQPAKPSQKSLKTKLTSAATQSISTTKHINVASSNPTSTSSNINEPIGTWETKNGSYVGVKSGTPSMHQQQQTQQQQQHHHSQQQQQYHQHHYNPAHSVSNSRIDTNLSSGVSWNPSRNMNRSYVPTNNCSNNTNNNPTGNNTNPSNNTHTVQHNLGVSSVTNHHNNTHSHHQHHHHHQPQHATQQQQQSQQGTQQSNTNSSTMSSGATTTTTSGSAPAAASSTKSVQQQQQHTSNAKTLHENDNNNHTNNSINSGQTVSNNNSNSQLVSTSSSCDTGTNYPSHPVLDKLRIENNYNPKEFDLSPKNARFFIIKSYSEDDIHRSIKYSIWCSTEHGNKRLDNAYRSQENKGPIFLFFSVNGSGHFCGIAQMVSSVDYSSNSSVWSQDKWKGQFKVKWIYVKDVPNAQLRHIRLENNENKPVTNSRDTQEVPFEKGKAVLKNIHNFRHTTSIFDDFLHYEKRQEEENARRVPGPASNSSSSASHLSSNSTKAVQHIENWND